MHKNLFLDLEMPKLMRVLRFSRVSIISAGQLIKISKSEYHIYYRIDYIMLSTNFK